MVVKLTVIKLLEYTMKNNETNFLIKFSLAVICM